MKLDILHLTGATISDEEVDMAPMIDIVFLLLIYFMVTTSLLKFETDLGVRLPGQVAQGVVLKMPDEQIIEVLANDDVVLNNRVYDSSASRDMPALKATLIRFKEAAALAQAKAMVTIQADDESTHQRVVDVMNATAEAGIKNVSFGLAGGG